MSEDERFRVEALRFDLLLGSRRTFRQTSYAG
jgi:hypothetical protein